MKQNIKYYNESIKHFIDLSTKDATANIAKEHGIIGLTRLNICMEKLDLDISNNFFIALPDFTYTRNALRWNAGFPYGCIINIGQTIPFIPIDFRPNCCGIIFAEVPNQDYDIEQIQKKYLEIINSYDDINPNDFNKRNHFFGLYYNAKKNTYYFLIHGSFSFAKKSLYSEKNDDLMARVCSIDILGTPFHFLKNDDASLYYNKYLYFEKKSMYYRELILKELFPEAQILFHRTHEGFMDMGTILLGAYADNLPFMCPIMLSPEEDLPITLNYLLLYHTLICLSSKICLFYKMKQVIISHKIKSMLIAENKHSDLKKDIISSITILNGNAALFESIYLCSHPA